MTKVVIRDPVVIEPRSRLTKKKRLEVLLSGKGKCCFCGHKIHGGFDVSHRIPLALGGRDHPDNMEPAHPDCHRKHTATTDVPNIAQAERRGRKHTGTWTKTRRPLKSRGFDPHHTRTFADKVNARKAKRRFPEATEASEARLGNSGMNK